MKRNKSQTKFILLTFALLIMLAMLWAYFDVFNNKVYLVKTKAASKDIEIINSYLPVIFDRNNKKLVRHKYQYVVKFLGNMTNKSEEKEIIGKIAAKLNVDSEQIYANYLKKGGGTDVRRNDIQLFITYNPDDISSLLISTELSQFIKYEIIEQREYLFEGYLGNIIGYRLRSDEGSEQSTGIEKYLLDTYRKSQLDYVNLTIDYDFQSFVHNEFSAFLKKIGRDSGSVLIADLDANELIVSVSLPNYDPNVFVLWDEQKVKELIDSKQNPMVNRASGLMYPPGSIMKLITSLSAIDNGIIGQNSTVLTEGCMKYANDQVLCEYAKNPFGQINIIDAIGLSSNIFYCKLFVEKGFGISQFNKTQQAFHLGEFSDLEGDSHAKGIISSPEYKSMTFNEDWYVGDSCNAAIGQGFNLVTPIQMLEAVSAIANDGKFIRYSYIKSISDKNGDLVLNKKTVDNISLKNNAFSIIKSGMQKSARINRMKFNSVFIKTGTAQLFDNIDPHTWVLGYYTAKNNTRYAFLANIENGKVSQNNVDFLNELFTKMQDDNLFTKFVPVN